MTHEDDLPPAPLPLVSVVIPAYNAAPFIAESIRSATAQTYRPLEIIVIDDHSTDGTAACVESLGVANLILMSLAQNSGASRARNVGIARATGKYIALLDADDRWLPEKLSRQIPLLEQDPELVLVGCNFIYMTDGIPGARLFDKHQPPTGNVPDAWKTLLKYPFISTPCAVFRKAVFDAIDHFDEKLVIAEDQDLWIRLAFKGKVGVVPDTLVEVHDLPGSLNKRELRREADCLLPMIERYVQANRTRLTRREIREILGRRNFHIGSNLYREGSLTECLPHFFRSLWYGYEPLRSLLVFLKAPAALLAGKRRRRT